MAEIKPNHICKNINCTKGADGGRKHYYACPSCGKNNSWRAVACSQECFVEYQKQVLEARSKGKVVDTLPERTDMTKEETKELLSKPADEVAEITKEELKDYAEEIESDGLIAVVDKINEELDEASVASDVEEKKSSYTKSSKKWGKK